jgi:hypothetical protein
MYYPISAEEMVVWNYLRPSWKILLIALVFWTTSKLYGFQDLVCPCAFALPCFTCHILILLVRGFLMSFLIQLFNLSATAQCLPGAWTTILKATPLATAEVASAIESYHHLLKLRLLNEADESIYQRADWLVHKLGTKVHSYYWLDEFSGKDSFSRYWKSEWKNGPNQWQQGLQIPDSDIAIEDNCARVVCQKEKERSHDIMNPGSELALCDCSWSIKGNLCKHVMKSTKVCRDRGLAPPSLALLRYYQALANVVHCPPSDSVVCDHAVAVAVSVRTQLEMLLGATNGGSLNTSAFKDPQSTSEPRDSNTQATSIENAACGSQSPAALDDINEVLMDEDSDQDSHAFKRRKSGGASDEDKAATAVQASDGDESTEEMQASDGDEGTAEMQASDGDEETAATPIMQPSETEGSPATPELNGSSDEVR